LLKDVDEFLKHRELGPDALDLGLGEFRKILEKHRGAVKSILMNQRIISGIGNIYADEILFRARIHPATEIPRLNDKALTKLFRATHYVLERAITARADTNQIPRSWLLPYRGKGGKCPRCGRRLKSATIGARTAWLCSHCQKRTSRS
jgi:formamidopyrimidine-DNA glycosylase